MQLRFPVYCNSQMQNHFRSFTDLFFSFSIRIQKKKKRKKNIGQNKPYTKKGPSKREQGKRKKKVKKQTKYTDSFFIVHFTLLHCLVRSENIKQRGRMQHHFAMEQMREETGKTDLLFHFLYSFPVKFARNRLPKGENGSFKGVRGTTETFEVLRFDFKLQLLFVYFLSSGMKMAFYSFNLKLKKCKVFIFFFTSN